MKRYVKCTTISAPSVYRGLTVKVDEEARTVSSVENLGYNQFEIEFTDGYSGIFDSNDMFEIVDQFQERARTQ